MTQTNRRTVAHPWLAGLTGCVGISALAGAAAMAGGAIDMGEEINNRLPFGSPTLGALALALVVGVPMAATAVRAATGGTRAAELAMGTGALLVGWIGVQLLVIRTFSWLQPVMAVAGIAVFLTGAYLHHRSTARP